MLAYDRASLSFHLKKQTNKQKTKTKKKMVRARNVMHRVMQSVYNQANQTR